MKREQIRINNETFTLKGTINAIPIATMKMKTLWDCYERPSKTKEVIYEDWQNWLPSKDDYLYVRSYNHNFFSLWGVVQHNNIDYYVEIYPTHNDAWIIEA